MKHISILLIAAFFIVSPLFSQENTLSLFFENDQFEVLAKHKKMLGYFKNDNTSNIIINGYTDAPASNNYNQLLSTKRAYNVYYYLLNHGVKIEDISKVNSNGEKLCGNSTAPNESYRRVDIIYNNKTTENQEIPETELQEEELVTQIETTEIGNKLIINNINFYPGRHFHLPQSEPQMQALLSILKDNPDLKIEIQGHICCQTGGSDGLDKDTRDNHLSVNRAQHIYSYLINKGIEANILSYKGFGSSKKIHQLERNEQERVANRRVEILILEK